ncbi:MAG TPA: SMP-30/gluconolactonase/LRE family protein, partial [Telluria sp.]|nr:SMP-30/gluconolactonase/LRE family protein [Telluria sp.]
MDRHFAAMRRASLVAALGAAAAFGVGCSGTAAGSSGRSSAAIVLPTLDIVAGQPSGQGYVDSMRNGARFSYPSGMRFDAAGNMYVADMRNSVIRRIGRDGTVSTVAGMVGITGSADGRGTAARFNYPGDVAVDAAGVLYVADSGNNTIRKIAVDGTVSTLAGAAGQSGAGDGGAADARFNGPNGVVLDGQGNLYVADSWNSVIRRITPDGQVSTLAGAAGSWGHADGTGAAAQFKNPASITIDGAGMLYVADGSTVRRITPAGVVTTIAGADGQDGETDGAGAAARFNGAGGIAADAAGNLFVADGGGNTVRKVTPDGVVTTLAGSGSSGAQNGTGG